MRKEIIFKAKRKDNGKWVYGAYFNMHHSDGRKHTHHFIIPDGTDMHFGTPLEKIQVEIDPDTLRVYTYAENTEPEEMLMIPRKKVQEIVELYNAHWVSYNTRKRLEEIFGRETLNQFKHK